MRTRDRYKHHRSDVDPYENYNDDISSSSSQYQSYTTKKRHNASIHVHLQGAGDDDTVLSNVTTESLSISGSTSFERKNSLQKYNRSDIDLHEQGKKMQSFRFHYLRQVQNKFNSPKKVGIAIVSFLIFALILVELRSTSGSNKDTKEQLERFLNESVGGVSAHPIKALSLFISLYIIILLCMLPGTPLTVGGSFVFSKTFGVRASMISITIAVLISTTVAYVFAFFVGRYFLHAEAKQRMRGKYPMFEVFDKAISKNAFRIISLLHLTPIVPFGPVSYMSGGLTSMPMLSFTLANLASVPLLVLYVFIGATAGQLFTKGDTVKGSAVTEEQQQIWMVILGIFLSFISIALISYVVKKELEKIIDERGIEKFDRQDSLEGSIYSEPDLQDDISLAMDIVKI